jgi:hypothetical protein
VGRAVSPANRLTSSFFSSLLVLLCYKQPPVMWGRMASCGGLAVRPAMRRAKGGLTIRRNLTSCPTALRTVCNTVVLGEQCPLNMTGTFRPRGGNGVSCVFQATAFPGSIRRGPDRRRILSKDAGRLIGPNLPCPRTRAPRSRNRSRIPETFRSPTSTSPGAGPVSGGRFPRIPAFSALSGQHAWETLQIPVRGGGRRRGASPAR